jgi:hypothetical protein
MDIQLESIAKLLGFKLTHNETLFLRLFDASGAKIVITEGFVQADQEAIRRARRIAAICYAGIAGKPIRLICASPESVDDERAAITEVLGECVNTTWPQNLSICTVEEVAR